MPDDDRLVTMKVFASAFEASLARGALQAAGIRAVIPGEALGTFCRPHADTSTRTLQVFAEDFDAATAELTRATMRAANTPPPKD